MLYIYISGNDWITDACLQWYQTTEKNLRLKLGDQTNSGCIVKDTKLERFNETEYRKQWKLARGLCNVKWMRKETAVNEIMQRPAPPCSVHTRMVDHEYAHQSSKRLLAGCEELTISKDIKPVQLIFITMFKLTIISRISVCMMKVTRSCIVGTLHNAVEKHDSAGTALQRSGWKPQKLFDLT